MGFEPCVERAAALERDDFSSSRHPALYSLLLEHDLFRKPESTFRDHALADAHARLSTEWRILRPVRPRRFMACTRICGFLALRTLIK
jgi:hypothetical protein